LGLVDDPQELDTMQKTFVMLQASEFDVFKVIVGV
jgi:hypothetical protein